MFCSSIECKTRLGRRRRDDPMINTISKTLEAQEKTQDIKQSPSTKIGTKPYARSRRNELAEATGLWTGCWKRDRTPDWWLSRQATGRWRQPTGRRASASDRVQRGSRRAKLRPDTSSGRRPDAGSVRSVVHGCNGRDDRTRPVRKIQRPVSSSFAGVQPQQLLSQWGL